MGESESTFDTRCVLYISERTERRHNIWTEPQDLQRLRTTVESKRCQGRGTFAKRGKVKRQKKLQNQLCRLKEEFKKQESLARRNENMEREEVGEYTGKAAYFRTH